MFFAIKRPPAELNTFSKIFIRRRKIKRSFIVMNYDKFNIIENHSSFSLISINFNEIMNFRCFEVE